MDTYELIFFRGTDLEYFPHQEMDMVKKHVLSNVAEKASSRVLEAITGIGTFLTSAEIISFIDIAIRFFIDNHEGYFDFKHYLDAEYWSIKENDTREAFIERLASCIEYLKTNENIPCADKLSEIIEYVKLEPFSVF